MELSILAAIIKYRSGREWKKEFIPALEKICEYRFVPIISREGAAIFPLLTECRELCAADRNIDGKCGLKRLSKPPERSRGDTLFISKPTRQDPRIFRR